MTPPPPHRNSVGPLRLGRVYALGQRTWVRTTVHPAFWSLQRCLNSLGFAVGEDADFGPVTEATVKDYQRDRGLDADGIAGGATHSQLVDDFIEMADRNRVLPRKLAKTQIRGESGEWLGAVNWLVAGGVDLCTAQRRVYASSWREPWPDYGAQFPADALERAFDSRYQIKLLVNRLKSLHDTYLARSAVNSSERAWRLAVLSHNYPAGADRLSRTKESDLSSYWTTPQKWVVNIGAHFPDGTVVQTPLQWCQRYSLGNAAHNEPGQMVKGVEF